ncbi:hypothetical protein PG994_005013 [Apiospora phragmitis]|uniref:GNAT family N-acetyltransferase n=1 Tax=Apiospora phragmitis TaxID=2905665 RepID=A0ABR1VS71_9PEZI
MTAADTDAAAVVYCESFKTDPANTYWWPKDLAPLLAWCSGRMRLKLRDPLVRVFKITDTANGEMVAFARWDVPTGSTRFGTWIGGENDKVDVTALVEGGDGTAAAVEKQPLTASADAAAPAPGDYPEGGTRGIAMALLAPMLDIADAEGRKTYLEATAAGKPLYERLGFRLVEVLEFNWDELTKERNGLYKNWVMIRDPVAQK